MGKRFNTGGKSMGKGGGGGNNVLQLLAGLLGGGGGGGNSWGKGGGGGKSGGKGGRNREPDPAGSGRVFVRGFDFGTTDEQFEGHMSKVGAIHAVHWVTKGSAVVVYKRKASAVKACSKLGNTTISGNSRYIDVIEKD